LISKNNIDRYFATGDLDIEYLFNLSTDSIPELCRLLNANDQNVVQEVKGHLAYVKKDIQSSSSWLEFNVSKYIAQKSIDKTN
jgi:ABC-type taurine transport system substrate-binding protein